MNIDKPTLQAHAAFVQSDNRFQREARLLQSLWRERNELPIGQHRGQPLGSRLAMPFAQTTLAGYLTEGIRDVVRAEVLDRSASAGKLYARPRIFEDLLSSQPMCFNLFGELVLDLDLATSALQALEPDIGQVETIRFEHSPGRGDAEYTGDRSAFDVFIEYTARDGARGFLGIEVKYHEALRDKAATHKTRYDEVADKMGCFDPTSRASLRTQPLQQIWRDHLLAGSLLQAGDFHRGCFVFLYPSRNQRCAAAVASYANALTDPSTFRTWTLEAVLHALAASTSAGWVARFGERYLGTHTT